MRGKLHYRGDSHSGDRTPKYFAALDGSDSFTTELIMEPSR